MFRLVSTLAYEDDKRDIVYKSIQFFRHISYFCDEEQLILYKKLDFLPRVIQLLEKDYAVKIQVLLSFRKYY